MIQLTYFTTFRVIFNAINKFYGHMPQKERGNYLCYITKDGWFDAKQGIESLKKVDIVLIPKRSNEHLDIITSSSKYRQFMSSHQYIGSFGFLFTMNPDWSVVDFQDGTSEDCEFLLNALRLLLTDVRRFVKAVRGFLNAYIATLALFVYVKKCMK